MIHKYKQLGLNIVMDVYSGAVHVVDDVMYDMLDYTLEPFMAEAKCPDYIKEGLKDKYSEEELEESYAEICALVNAGQLFTDDCYDEIAKNWNKQSVVKALCIHVAHQEYIYKLYLQHRQFYKEYLFYLNCWQIHLGEL